MIAMKCEIRSYIGTRRVQEDHAGYCVTDKGLFAVVCDGIGSRSNGGTSSELTVEHLIKRFREDYKSNFPSFITSSVSEADEMICGRFGPSCGTTALAAFVEGDRLFWLSVGDSRIYIIRHGKIRQITTDHNYGYVLELRREKGIIDEETYRRELHKADRLASFVGMGGIDLVDISLEPLILKPGDRLLLATDGLYKSLTETEICAIISSDMCINICADELMDCVKKLDCALDNTTFALIYYDKLEEEP